MTNEERTIVEINGVKMEVDLRRARIVHDNLRVGSRVKILAKGGYSGVTVHTGIIVGFELFPSQPTITVAYLNTGYGAEALSFAHINSSTADKWEMVPSIDDELPVEKADVLARFDRDINKKQAELDELEAKRAFFLKHFAIYFPKTAEQPA